MNMMAVLLFWLHLSALALGGAAIFGLPLVRLQAARTTADARPAYMSLSKVLSQVGRAAFVILVVSGPLLFWLKWNWDAPSATWFALKIVLVTLLLGLIILSGVTAKAAQRGDARAIARAPVLSTIAVATYLLLILSAVLAFN